MIIEEQQKELSLLLHEIAICTDYQKEKEMIARKYKLMAQMGYYKFSWKL